MNKKIVPIIIVLCLLFTFSVVNVVYGMQQMLFMDLNRNHTERGYYVGQTNHKLHNLAMTVSKECPKMCMVKDQPKMCMVTQQARMCMVKGQERVNNFSRMSRLNGSSY